MKNDLSNIAGSALEDIAAIFQVPGFSTLKTVWNNILENKIRDVRDALLDEIEEGDFSGIPQDDLVSIIHRYLQASISGSAKLNLRILARLIKGITQNDEVLVPGLYASEFNRYSNMLADLTYEELLVLVTLQKFRIQNEKEQEIPGPQTQIRPSMRDNAHYYYKARDWLSGNNVNIDGHISSHKKIISSEEFDAIATSLVRTGLVNMKAPTVTFGGGVNLVFELTPLFFKLTKLIELQTMFEQEESF